MRERDIARGMAFQHLGVIGTDKESMRLAQAKVYLSESLGSGLGFAFSWKDGMPWSDSLESYLVKHLDILVLVDFRAYRFTENNIRKPPFLNVGRNDANAVLPGSTLENCIADSQPGQRKSIRHGLGIPL